MASSLPSPPPHPTLAYSSLPLDQLEALRSSCAQLLLAIEEVQGMVNWGGEAGIIGWPSLLSAYQRIMSLVSLLNHHMTASTTVGGPGSKPILVLSQHVVHPHLPIEQGSNAWIQALLSTHAVVAHDPPPDTATAGDNSAAHEQRRQRALRVCAALAERHDWKGRVGIVDEGPLGEDDDMFGEDDAGDRPAAPVAGVTRAGEEAQVPDVQPLVKKEREKELRRLLGMMARGEPPS